MTQDQETYNLYKYALENIQDIVWELDPCLNFTFVSPNAKLLSGYEDSEMIGYSLMDFLSSESRERIITQWKEIQQERVSGGLKKIVFYDAEFIRKDGTVLWYEVSVKPVFNEKKFTGYIGTSRDVSEKKAHELEIKKYIAELEYTNKKLDEMATFDMLTGAYNRRKFEEYIALSVQKTQKDGEPFSIIMFDIDCFKKINDVFGHKMGDFILQEVSFVVNGVLQKEDKLFRWGGDEFIVLMQETNLEQACNAAERIRKVIEKYDFGKENEGISISLGVGEFKPCDNMDQFVSDVDKALLNAKSKGKNRMQIISDSFL